MQAVIYLIIVLTAAIFLVLQAPHDPQDDEPLYVKEYYDEQKRSNRPDDGGSHRGAPEDNRRAVTGNK